MNSANDVASTTPSEAFFEGIIDRGSQKKVAIAVNVNFELKDGQKERGHAIPVHVIPLMRRMHPGGVVKVLSQWARGVPRVKELTQEELKTELEGLMRSYGMKMPGQAASIMAEVYGATEADQLRNLHAKMAEVYHAWVILEREGRKRLAAKYKSKGFSELAIHGMLSEVITDEELGGLVSIIEPEREELAEIQLPELSAITTGDDDADDDGEGGEGIVSEDEAITWLTTELETVAKMPQQDALELTAMVIESGEKDPDDKRLGTFKCLQKSDGTLHQKKAEQVKRILAKYRAKLAPASV